MVPQKQAEVAIVSETIGNLSTKLRKIQLCYNQLSGSIPSGIRNLINLERIWLVGNQFTGNLPFDTGKLQKLHDLDFSKNEFSGNIPSSLGNLSLLIVLDLSQNILHGNIPPSLGNCKNLLSLSLAHNKLRGPIPQLVIGLSSLSQLDPSQNYLTSSLPVEVGNLKNLGYLNVFENMLFGEIPGTLGSCVMLETLCMEGNLFRGTIPSTLASLRGIQFLDLSRNNLSGRIPEYLEAFKLLQILNLSNNDFGGAVPTKGVDYQGNDFKALVYDFMENGSLEEWLHQVKREDELHNEPKKQNLNQRLNISIDVACALDYLHHDCQTPIVHCDLKPSNILLSKDMIGHVGDFGLARILQEVTHNFYANQESSIGLRGSIGYTAPEYSLGCEISTNGDIYSYGILLLEMMTGKRPTDSMFEKGLNLHSFAKMALPDHVMEIADPVLNNKKKKEARSTLSTTADAIGNTWAPIHLNNGSGLVECLISIVKIGVACSTESPQSRMSIRNILHELHLVKNKPLQDKHLTRYEI